ncbi:MAG: hypothetical protein ACREAK_10495 [Nitrosarchaeum sp.]
MVSKLKILEKHISEQVLPKEEILAWIKWESNFDFDQILIKSEADINLHRILNVEDKVLTQEDIKKGRVVIDKNMLHIDGFIGFGCFYELIPEQERELTFEIEFKKNDEIADTISLKTNLIRPIIAVEDFSNNGIVVTKDRPVLPQLSFNLVSKGKARILNFVPFLELVNAKEMEITLKHTTENIEDEKPLFVHSIQNIIPKIIVKGKGYGMITMGFQYFDAMGNKYESKLIDIPIQIEQKETLEVPIASDLKGQSTILLEPKIS